MHSGEKCQTLKSLILKIEDKNREYNKNSDMVMYLLFKSNEFQCFIYSVTYVY